VQLTWQDNYKKYGDILTLDLVNNLDMALPHNVALFVLVHGFQTGTFTGRKLTDYITASQTDFVNARRCINGTDHAQDIANVAQGLMTTL
jgi:predicted chitinase